MTSSGPLFAFSLTLLAGLATGVGSFLALFARRTNTRFLAGALGFSAGVMIYVSFAALPLSSLALCGTPCLQIKPCRVGYIRPSAWQIYPGDG